MKENTMTDKLIEALVKAQSEINQAVQDADNPFLRVTTLV